MKYDVNYFIKKFEAKPAQNWAVGTQWDQYGKSCALGDCSTERMLANGETTKEGKALQNLFKKCLGVYVPHINNGIDFVKEYAFITAGQIKIVSQYNQPTPKQRILAALYDIKRMQEESDPNKPKVEYKLVFSDQKVKELVNEKLILS